ncbi:hypothetical protein HWI79_3115 [Cryptosporidium felis]|nr:hypothetical protein HWI79_3115 [Cryptosporidium felis]
MKFNGSIICALFSILVWTVKGAPNLNVRNPMDAPTSNSVPMTMTTTSVPAHSMKLNSSLEGSEALSKMSAGGLQSETNCEEAVFPAQVFAAQPRDDRVYVKPSKIPDSGFTRAGLTKFTTAFGVHILGDKMVPDDKMTYLTELLASVLDNDQDGLVDATQNTILETIRSSNAMMVLLSGNEDSIEKLLDPEQGLPPEYSCMMFLLVEQAKNIIRGGPHQKNCPEDLEKTNDRGLGFVVDFISQAAYPVTFSLNEESSMRMEKMYNSALSRGWFLPQNIPVANNDFCDEDCKRLSFQSWLATSILDQDKCSCIKANVFKLCSSDEIRRISPDDFAYFASALKRPTAYSSSAVIH